MKRNIAKILIIFAVCTVFLCICLGNVFAVSYKGSAIYRMKENNPLELHAGLINSSVLSDTYDCIVHMTSGVSSGGMDWVSMSSFMGGRDFYWIAKPNDDLNDTQINNVSEIARQLSTKDIAYTLLKQIDYDSDCYDNARLSPSDITAIRCDGVVEYCYERYDIRIFGNNTYWNISVPSSGSKSQHALPSITPNIQCTEYMTLYYSGSY